jgi:hypothetical protein
MIMRGQIEAMVRANISHLDTNHPMRDALAEMAYELARLLDIVPHPGIVTDSRDHAALNRELRATLAELAGATSGEDDDDLSVSLSSPVRDGT